MLEPSPQLRRQLIGSLLFCCASTLVASAAPPAWWNNGTPPVIDPNATANNHGVANIGQAKWVAKNALETIRSLDAAMAQRIEANLVGNGKPIASWNAPATQAERDQQKSVLLVGQLKAIAAPFYAEIHGATPAWLTTELTANGTNTGSGYFPWTETAVDDANRAAATIGQLKAVFGLHFTESNDGDTTPDFVQSYQSPSEQDSDGDGVSDAEEIAQGTNPNQKDAAAVGLMVQILSY